MGDATLVEWFLGTPFAGLLIVLSPYRPGEVRFPLTGCLVGFEFLGQFVGALAVQKGPHVDYLLVLQLQNKCG